MSDLNDEWIEFGGGISVQIHEHGAHWRVVDARQESLRDGDVVEVRLLVPPAQVTARIFTTHEAAIESVRQWLEDDRA